MVNFLNLPTVQAPRNALADLSPIGNAIDGNRRNALANLESQRQDEQLAMQRDNQMYQRGRDQKQDAWQEIQRGGQAADAIQRMPDGPQKQAAWGNYLKTYGNGDHTPEELDYRTGPAIAAAAAGKFLDPMERQAANLDMEYKRAQINQMNQKGDGSFNQRAQAAQSYGLDPNSDAGKAYILTGKLPREDQQSLTATDKKAILEADENVGTNRAGIQAIDQAKALNPKANSGWGANLRAQIGANLPDMLVPDFISSPESSTATIDFDNAVIGQALGQLKATFGGNPTEGERKILLDLQGASGKPAAVRAEILQRARVAAENRLRLNEQRAQELRGGSYYRPGGGSAAANPMSFNSNAGDPLAEARAAIAAGADPAKVMQRLQQNGIDPRGLQ